LIFYAWGEPIWVSLLVFSAFIDYIHGLLIHKFRGKVWSKIALISSLTINLGILAIFKYSGFLVTNINELLSLNLTVPSFKLPIGISFYTFQTISYTIDCYWDKVKVQKSFLNFLMYVSLFPQLVAGPIVKYSTIEKEITSRKTTISDLSKGFTRVIIGLAKKVIIANNLSLIVDTILGGNISSLSYIGTWYGAIVYALQVYYDFSGYSDMAIGLGLMFGFHFDENFNYPFICKDISEFWQRWHISLGTFFKDYLLYLPLFGKRRKYASLFLVWFCTGLWHGASWNYIIWGLYFGIFVFIESFLGKKKIKKIPMIVRHIYSKLIIFIGFGIFYFENLKSLLNFFKNLFFINGNAFIDDITKISFANNIILILIAVVFCFPITKFIEKLREKSTKMLAVLDMSQVAVNVALLLISSIMLVDATNNPFLYFRF
jgi:alginate O-acetyltransferase complex protein AlgI